MSDTAEVEAPVSDAEVHPIDAAIKAAKAGWAKESKPKGGDEPAKAEVADTDKAEDAAPVSDDGATAADTVAEVAPAGAGTSDLSWLPAEFHSPQSRQGKKFLDFVKRGVHAEAKFTKDMQALSAEKKQYAADLEVGQTIRTKRPDIAEIAFRMSKGETIHDIAASMKPAEQEGQPFNYAEATPEEIDARIETLAEKRERANREKDQREKSESEESVKAVQSAIVSFVRENNIDPDAGFAAIQAASEAIKAGDEIPWSAEKAGTILSKYLKGGARKNTVNGKNGEAGLSKVASPTGLGVGAKSVPVPLSAETRKKWANGEITDEDRKRIFMRLPVSSRRASEDGAADE